jgi:hypothetical protein
VDARFNKPAGPSKPHLRLPRASVFEDIDWIAWRERETKRNAQVIESLSDTTKVTTVEQPAVEVPIQVPMVEAPIAETKLPTPSRMNRAGSCRFCRLTWAITSLDEADSGDTQFCCDEHLLLVAQLYDKMVLEVYDLWTKKRYQKMS